MPEKENKLSLDNYLMQQDVAFYEYQGKQLPDFILEKQNGTTLFLSKNKPKSLADIANNNSISFKQYRTVYDMAAQAVDVCFLDGRSVKALFAGLPGTAHYVLVRLIPSIHWLIALPGLVRRQLSKQLQIKGITRITTGKSSSQWLVLFRPKIIMPIGGYLSLSANVGVQSFLDYLRKEKVRYVVLRFYEDLPSLGREGGDLDVLVANEDEYKIRDFLHKHPGSIKVDIWPVANPNFNTASYYPTPLARSIIENAVDGPAGSRIPDPKHAFLSFAYHALYHKGVASGIPSSIAGLTVETQPENTYAAMLTKMANSLNIKLRLTMENLDEYLQQQGWQPKLDTLAKIAPENEWVKRRFFSVERDRDIGLRVFILREKALHLNLVDSILQKITQSGEFRILKKKKIGNDEKQYVADHLRGGVWTDQFKNLSDYLPAMAVIVLDLHAAHRSRLKSNQSENNLRTKNLKKLIRETFDQESTSLVHSTDNSNEAWEYINICFPVETGEIKKQVEEVYGKLKLSWLERLRMWLMILPSRWIIIKQRLRNSFIRIIVE